MIVGNFRTLGINYDPKILLKSERIEKYYEYAEELIKKGYVVEKEKAIQIDIAMNEGKPAEIAEKMVTGRMKKFTGEISLTGQAFIMEPKSTVGQVLKEKGVTVSSFVRLEVGEGIEKKEEDFAAEVEAQIAAAKGE